MLSKQLDNAVFCKMEENYLSVPKITDCIRIDDKLHVQLFHNSCSIPLPSWFKDKNCTLNSVTQIENIPSYTRSKCTYSLVNSRRPTANRVCCRHNSRHNQLRLFAMRLCSQRHENIMFAYSKLLMELHRCNELFEALFRYE